MQQVKVPFLYVTTNPRVLFQLIPVIFFTLSNLAIAEIVIHASIDHKLADIMNGYEVGRLVGRGANRVKFRRRNVADSE